MSAIGNSLPQPVPSNHKVIGVALVIIGIIAAVAAFYMGFSPLLPQLQRFILAGALGVAAIAFIIAGVVTARKAPIEGTQIISRRDTASTKHQSIALFNINPKTNVKFPLFNALGRCTSGKQADEVTAPNLGLTLVVDGIPDDKLETFLIPFLASLCNIKLEANEEARKKQFEKVDELLNNAIAQLKSEEGLAKHFERAIKQFAKGICTSELKVSFCIMLGYNLGGTVKFITASAGNMNLHVLSKQEKWTTHPLSTSNPLSQQSSEVQIAIHPFEDAARIVGASFKIDQSQLPSLDANPFEASEKLWKPHENESAACFVLDMIDPNGVSRNAKAYGQIIPASSYVNGQHDTTFSARNEDCGVVMTETNINMLDMFRKPWNNFNSIMSATTPKEYEEQWKQCISAIETAFCESSYRPSFILAQCFFSDGQVKLVTTQAGGNSDLFYHAENEQVWSITPLTSNDPLGSKKGAFTVKYHDFRKDGTIVIVPRKASEILKTIKSESIDRDLAEQLEEQKIKASWLTFEI